MHSFDNIYLADLHGNSKKKEKPPEGGKDENVFDIQQGVAVGVFSKQLDSFDDQRVHHVDLWGNREQKYGWLQRENAVTSSGVLIEPSSPFYFFFQQDHVNRDEYETLWRITDFMSVHGLGFQSSRDHLVVGFTQDELRNRIETFVNSEQDDEEIRETFFPGKSVRNYLPGDTRQWSLSAARKHLQKDKSWTDKIRLCLYRPLDFRYILYDSRMVDWPRPQVLGHMLHDNLCLLANRQSKEPFAVFCAAALAERKIAAVYDASTSFPLYLYPSNNLLDSDEQERKPNLAPEFVEELTEALDLRFISEGKGDFIETFGPEDMFHYIYAVFHSPTYRERYAEFLRRDFPRLPLTSDRTLFSDLSQWGEELVSLHLMRSSSLNELFTTFPKSGSNVMEKAKYDVKENRIYINKEQYFENVSEATWNFRVGGYQVLDKWLKDRKGRTLTPEDIEHYRRVVAALYETSQIMEEIDEVIEEHGGWPLAGSVKEEQGAES
jgi:predicted helicase